MTVVAELVDVLAVVKAKLAEIDEEIGRRTMELRDLSLAREKVELVLVAIADVNGPAPVEPEPEPAKPKQRRYARALHSRPRRRPGAVVEDVYAWITANVAPEADIFSAPIAEALQMERSSVLRALEKLAQDGRLRFDRQERMTAARGRASKVYRLVELGTV